MKRHLTFAAIATLALLLAGCGTVGDILGGPQASSYPSTGTTSDLYGTVNSVDSSRQQVNVTVNDYNNGNRSMWVPYDSRTQVTYQGQYGSPTQLERGDQVTIRMRSNGVADLITVTQSVSASTYPNNSGTYPTYPNTPYPSSQSAGRISGTVNYVDTSARLIQLSNSYINGLRTNDSTYTIYYDSRTRVTFQGRDYTPADLERGDQVDVTTYNTGGQTLADTITVTRNVRQ